MFGASAATIAAVAAMAGAAITAYSTVQAGENAKDVADYNAEMQRRAAHDAEQRGSIEAADKRQETRRLIARQHAAMGAGGGDADSGTNLQLLTESAGMGELDSMRIRYNAMNQASGLRAQADLGEQQGKQQRTGAYTSAGGQLLQSGASAYYGFKK